MTSQPAGGTQPAAPDTAAPANQALAHPAPVHHVVRRTRIGGTWVAAALGTGAHRHSHDPSSEEQPRWPN